ncbi:MAG TPA: hypothetical protein VGH42_11205 [Verrucomicrobiae bacterium]|jgi:hypothetical protein
MSSEIQAIIDDLRRHVPSNPIHRDDVHTFQSFHIARLHALVAEQQAKSAKKLERFTWLLVCLTGALIFIGVVQIVLMFCGH